MATAPETIQAGLHQLTEVFQLLGPDIEKYGNQNFALHTPVARELKRKCVRKKAGGHQYRYVSKLGPSWNARFADVGDDLPGEEPTVNGSTERIDQSRIVQDNYLCLQYGGITIDGPTLAVARGGKSLADPLAEDFDDVMEMLGYLVEQAVAGRGTGELAEVSSVSGSNVTLKASDTTLANAGQYGGTNFPADGRGMPLVFVNSVTGAVRTVGGNAGFLSRGYDYGSKVLRLNRAATGVQAGDFVTFGDDNANQFNKVPIGIDGWVDNGLRRRTVFGLNRGEYPHLNCFRIDAKDGSDLGEFKFNTFQRAHMAANFKNGGMPNMVLHHHYMSMEMLYGALIDNGATRTQPGLVADRRFTAKGELNSGATGVTLQTPQFGTLRFVGAWNIRPNTAYLINARDFCFIEHREGMKFLPGNGLDKGAFVRSATKDRWNAVLRYMWTMHAMNPNKHARIDNLLQVAPDY